MILNDRGQDKISCFDTCVPDIGQCPAAIFISVFSHNSTRYKNKGHIVMWVAFSSSFEVKLHTCHGHAGTCIEPWF